MRVVRPRLLRRIAGWLVRGPHARHVIRDLDEFFARDLERGVSVWTVRRRYIQNMLASAASTAGFGKRLRRGFGFSWLDFVVGARMLVRYPALTLIGGLGIAVAIAVGVVSFTFLYSTLYPTIPLEEGDRLVGLENWDVEVNNEARQAFHDYVEWRDSMTTVSEFAAFRPVGADLVGGRSTERIRIAQMTPSGFRMARVAPIRGRFLVDQDAAEGAPPVLVIGHAVWQSQFAGDLDVVGREIRVGRTPHTIVGVMPEGYGFPFAESYWAPLRIDLDAAPRGEGPAVYIFGRLAPGATPADAQAELAALGERAALAYPETHEKLRPRVHPYTYPLMDIQGIGFTEVGAFQMIVALILIVVAVNVAVLMYARTATRAGELAVRSALGASRRRLVTQLVTESLVLTLAAGAVGVGLAQVFVRQLNRLMEMDLGVSPPFWSNNSIPLAAWLYTAAMIVLTTLLIGALPTIRATGRGLRAGLGQLGGTTSMQFGRMWTVLIVAQVAITVSGLPAAMSMGWTVAGSVAAESAFAANELTSTRVSMQMDFPPRPAAEARATYDGPYRDLIANLIEQLQAEPDVTQVTLASRFPGHESTRSFEMEAATADTDDTQRFEARSNEVGLDFFAAFDAPVLEGREFAASDLAESSLAVLVNETFAQRLLGGRNPVGRRLRYVSRDPDAEEDQPWHEIVGTIADLHVNRADPDWVRPTIYHPLAVAEVGYPAQLIMRLPGDAIAAGSGEIAARFQQVTASVDPSLRLVGTQSIEQAGRQERLAVNLTLLAMGLVVASVLLLSAAGVYALMSFTVTNRRHEIGIRSALGGRPQFILRAIFARALRQLAMGVGVGVFLAVLLDGMAGGAVIGDKSLTLVPVTAVVLLMVGALAAFGPARRGLRVQPTDALRDE